MSTNSMIFEKDRNKNTIIKNGIKLVFFIHYTRNIPYL